MTSDFLPALGLALAIAFLSIAGHRLRAAPSILMLLTGVVIAFVPGFPPVVLEPDFVLLLLLPPLLYFSGVSMSWRSFRSNARPILLLAIGCVLFTTASVATVAHFILGVPWPVGFVLGAIISPPDAVAPTALLRFVRLPRRLIVILEGESLVNDATALVALSFALGAVATGTFAVGAAAVKFVAVVGGELVYGVALGWVMLRIRHHARDPRAEVLLALATPYLAFWPAHEIGGSGVVACVAAGLYVSWNGRKLIQSATRLQGFFIWDLVAWGVEALVFLLMGLQARAIVGKLSSTGWTEFLHAGAIVTITIVAVRFIWVFASSYGPRLIMAARPVNRDADWRWPLVISLTGFRGVVSLAAALSIPLTLGDAPFPHRDLVLFVTFFVIIVTLVGIGSILPWTTRALGLDVSGHSEAVKAKRAERAARLHGIRSVLRSIDRMEADGEATAVINALRRQHTDRLALMTETADETTKNNPAAETAGLQLRLIQTERSTITRLYESNRLGDEARRRIERELDLEEARSKHARASASSVEEHRADPARGEEL